MTGLFCRTLGRHYCKTRLRNCFKDWIVERNDVNAIGLSLSSRHEIQDVGGGFRCVSYEKTVMRDGE